MKGKLKSALIILLCICIWYCLLQLVFVRGVTFLFGSTKCTLILPTNENGTPSTREYVLTADELDVVRSALNLKLIYADEPSCGFSEDHALRFYRSDRLIAAFELPLDACPNYMVGDRRCASTNEKNARKISEIVRKYVEMTPEYGFG